MKPLRRQYVPVKLRFTPAMIAFIKAVAKNADESEITVIRVMLAVGLEKTKQEVPRLPTLWISRGAALPTKADSDIHERVWAVATDAQNRPYPCEAFWKHVRRSSVYTHWMRPEWGYDIKRDRRAPTSFKRATVVTRRKK